MPCNVITLQTRVPDRGQAPLQRDVVADGLVQRGRRCDGEVCCKMFCAEKQRILDYVLLFLKYFEAITLKN